jgi:hypothetical protein
MRNSEPEPIASAVILALESYAEEWKSESVPIFNLYREALNPKITPERFNEIVVDLECMRSLARIVLELLSKRQLELSGTENVRLLKRKARLHDGR